MASSLRTTDVSPRAALFSIFGLIVVMTGAIFGIVKLMNRAPAVEPAVPPAALQSATFAPASSKTTPVKVSRNYRLIVKRNLFRSTGKAAPAGSGPLNPLPIGVLNAKNSATVTKIVPPFTPPKPTGPKLAYTGHVEIAGVTYALIENLDQSVAQYTRVDGMAFGCRLTEIAARYVTLDQNGQKITLQIGDNKVEDLSRPQAAAAQPPNPAPAAAQPAPTPTPAPANTGNRGFGGRFQGGGGNPGRGNNRRGSSGG